MSAPVKSEPLGDEEFHMETTAQEDDDEIVREIDVYLSPELESQLYLMQFPLQHHQSVPLPQAARIKPQHGMIELDQTVPRTFVRQDLPDALNLFQRTYVSHTIPVSTHLALGRIETSPVDNRSALHLVPLSHVTQMRPDFNHIDEAMNPNPDPDGDPNSDDLANKLEKKPVMFQKKESERAAMARQNSYAYKKASEASEEWQHLQTQGPGTAAHARVQQAIACPSPHTPLVHLSHEQNQDPSADFVLSLNYLPATRGTETATLDGMEIDVIDLKQVCKKVTHLLQRGWPVPYSVIRARFPPALDDQELLTALSACAFLVRGNFVLQSRLMSMPVPIQQARTFLLLLIHAFGYVERFRLHQVYKGDAVVTPDVIQMLLQQVATKCLNGWKSKVDDNLDFCQRFPEQTHLHMQYWERQTTRFAAELQKYQQAVFH